MKIRDWKKYSYGHNLLEKTSITELITAIDQKEEESSIDEAERLQRLSLKGDLESIALAEASLWRQKCKKLWLLEGDENTAFFHKVCTARRRKGFI